MDFELTPEQKGFAEEVERFAKGLIGPAEAVDPVLNTELLRQLGSMHLMGVVAPPEEEGGGKDHVSYALALLAVSRKSVSTGAMLFVNNSLYLHSLLAQGNIEQRKRYLLPCCTGEGMGTAPVGYPFMEAADIRMNAVRNGAGWSLRGRHSMVASRYPPSHAVLPAVTGEGPEVSLFVLELGNTPGLRLAPGDKADLVAEDAILPEDALLGPQGKGMDAMAGSLPFVWVGIAAHAVGIGRSILDRAVEYSLAGKRSGKPLFSSQSVQWTLADTLTELDAAQFLLMRAAWLLDRKKPCEKEAAMAKLYASDAALKAATNGGRIMGESGLEHSLWDLFRHAERCQSEQGSHLRIKGYITSRLVRELTGT